MHLRRSTALALGALLLSAPALTACGFNYATNRINTIQNGATNRDAKVDVLAAVVVSAADDSGTFVASFSNNDQANEASVASIAGADGSTLQPGDFSPITIPPGGFVNLAVDGGVPVSGTFKAGQFLPITVTFGNGERVALKVPVVTADGNYEGLDVSGGAASPATPSASTSESPSESSSASPGGTSSASPSASPS